MEGAACDCFRLYDAHEKTRLKREVSEPKLALEAGEALADLWKSMAAERPDSASLKSLAER